MDDPIIALRLGSTQVIGVETGWKQNKKLGIIVIRIATRIVVSTDAIEIDVVSFSS